MTRTPWYAPERSGTNIGLFGEFWVASISDKIRSGFTVYIGLQNWGKSDPTAFQTNVGRQPQVGVCVQKHILLGVIARSTLQKMLARLESYTNLLPIQGRHLPSPDGPSSLNRDTPTEHPTELILPLRERGPSGMGPSDPSGTGEEPSSSSLPEPHHQDLFGDPTSSFLQSRDAHEESLQDLIDLRYASASQSLDEGPAHPGVHPDPFLAC